MGEGGDAHRGEDGTTGGEVATESTGGDTGEFRQFMFVHCFNHKLSRRKSRRSMHRSFCESEAWSSRVVSMVRSMS